MLKVYHSNSLSTLRDVLVEMIAREPLADPFCAEQILVQSPGMAQWLKLELAQRIGIAANIEFPLPASFLWRTFSQLLIDVPERSAYSKESMTWILMSVLPNYLAQAEFQSLTQYLAEDPEPIRLYQLCEQIADLFDQYLVYRPDWIGAWEKDDNAPADVEQLWQPILWRAIVSDNKRRELPHWHRANMYDAFIQAIDEAPDSNIPQRLFVFGISALPDNYLQALVRLGKRCDIHLMVANPCRQFWSDIVDKRFLGSLLRQEYVADKTLHNEQISKLTMYEQGNPLLASMGKLGRDYLYMLTQLELPEVDLFSDDNHESLLSSLQSDILSLKNRKFEENDDLLDSSLTNNARLSVKNTDASIELHSCYSPMREVEVLQDQLLAMLENNTQLEARDIIVMVPDVSKYSPFIEAVFGQASNEKYLPFSISDRNAQQESPLIANFLNLLNLSKSRYGCSQILELMSLPAILRTLEFDEVTFEKVRHWIVESGIKWGLDAQNREVLELPSFNQNSWQFGLDRMFAGFVLGDIKQTWQGISPYSEIAGLEAESLGQLYYFFDVLQRCKTQFTRCCSLSDWVEFFHQLLNDIYQADDEDLAALELIYNALETLQTTLDEVHYDQDISAEIILDYLQQNLSAQRSSQRFLSGKINFCTLMPMRAIPFQVVCLLGMNDVDYPRSVPAMGFDLMVEHSRKGDRSRRDDDRYLFLEALLSARSALYISYVGHSLTDNSQRNPSVLVSELFEYIQQGFFLESSAMKGENEATILMIERQGQALLAHLTTEHPLTAYHMSYFDQSNDLFSYAKQWLPIANLNAQQNDDQLASDDFSHALPLPIVEVVQLKDLTAFFKQPIKYFLQHTLQVNFVEEIAQIDDEEPFELNGLDNYIVRDRLLNTALCNRSTASYSRYLQASGVMPLGVAGDKNVTKNCRDATELCEKIQPLMKGSAHRLAFDLSIAEVQLQGWIEPLFESGVVKYSAANSSGRIYISTWIEHLSACANGCQHTTYFRAINEQFHFKPVAPSQAIEYLATLIELFKQGLAKPLAWLPDIGWQLQSTEDIDKTMQKIEKNYNLFEDPYILRVYPKWRDLAPGLQRINHEIFEPLSQYLVIDTSEDT